MKFILGFILIFITYGCGGGSDSSSSNNQNPYPLSLAIKANHDFNPNVSHGEVDHYNVTISGDALDPSISLNFPAGTKEALFDDLPIDEDLFVEVKALNYNGYTIRRGLSNRVNIPAGETIQAEIGVNNVPVFANVKEGSIVYKERFVPRIFAPGNISFQIGKVQGNSFEPLSDINGDLNFSISDDLDNSLMPLHIGELENGRQKISVKDPSTGEITSVEILVISGASRSALPTTAGGFMGSLVSINQSNNLSSSWADKLANEVNNNE